MNFVNWWLLQALILVERTSSYVMDISKINNAGSDIWTFLCDFPVLSSGSEELLVPGYYFSLEKGGRMSGYIKIATVEDLDDNLVVPDIPVTRDAEGPETVLRSEFYTLDTRKAYPVFSVRLRRPRRNRLRNHHSYLYLYQALFEKEETTKLEPPVAAPSEDASLDNVFLVLFSQSQWQLYLSTGPYDTVQPSRNKRGFVYYSNVISKLRIPITRVGDVVSFEFEADQTDRYVLMLFNPDQRKMTLEGYVKYDNTVAVNLPTEMRYHMDILKFWWLVNLLAFVLSVGYVYFYHRQTSKKVNYLLSLNYLLYTTFLLLDIVLLHFLKQFGMVPRFMWALSHIFKRLHEIYILTLMVLLSLGWKILRETLSPVEFQLISAICTVCVLMGFVEVIVSGFDISRYLVHAIACICILVAANFNIVIINTRIADEGLTPQAGLAYYHMKMFSNFRLVFFVYMFKPAIFSLLRFVCLQPTFDQVIIWDQHLNLFIDLTFDFFVNTFLFLNFLPRSKKGLFNHIFQNQAVSQEAQS